MNLVLHSIAFALVAWIAVRCLRHPRLRAAAALTGLLAAGILPWFSAIRLPEKEMPAALQTPARVLPSWRITLKDASPSGLDATSPVAAISTSPPTHSRFLAASPLSSWQALGLLWLTGTVLWLLLDVRAIWRIRVWRRSLVPLTDEEWSALSSELPLDRSQVWRSNEVVSPCVTGFFRPRLVIPRFLLVESERQHLLWAIRHETEHLNGHDLRWLALFRLIRAVFWWNPFHHVLLAQWTEAREQLCDLHAADSHDERASYGEFLVALGSRSALAPAGILAMADRGFVVRMKRRLISLLTGTTDRPLGKGFVCSAVAAVFTCAIVLPSFGKDAAVSAPAIASTPPTPPAPTDEEDGLPQIKISSRLVFSSQPLVRNGEVIQDAKREELLRMPGSRVEVIPSIVARTRQEATIEIIRGNPADAPPPLTQQDLDRDDPEFEKSRQIDYLGDSGKKFLGFIMNFHPEIRGSRLHLSNRLAYSFVPGLEQSFDKFPEPTAVQWANVHRCDTSLEGDLEVGETIAATFGEIEPGKYLTVFATVVPIDATGRPVGRFDEQTSFRAPKPANPAPYLRVKGTLVDYPAGSSPVLRVPNEEPLPLDEKSVGTFLGFFSAEQVAAIRSGSSIPARDLPEIRILSGAKRSLLWKEDVPRFWLGATAQESTQVIDLNYRLASYPGKEPAVAGYQTGITVYNSYTTVLALDPPPGIKQRLLLLQVEIEKSEKKSAR
ncbi:MAG: M56 family metallopeptidase [Luteolibacter sp.]